MRLSIFDWAKSAGSVQSDCSLLETKLMVLMNGRMFSPFIPPKTGMTGGVIIFDITVDTGGLVVVSGVAISVDLCTVNLADILAVDDSRQSAVSPMQYLIIYFVASQCFIQFIVSILRRCRLDERWEVWLVAEIVAETAD